MTKESSYYSKPITTFESEDALSQILNSIGISGSLLLKEDYCTPWAVSVPPSDQLNTLLKGSRGIHVATFHLVERGQLKMKLDNKEELIIDKGEMIVCFSGQGHTLYQGESRTVTPFQTIMAGAKNIYKPNETTRHTSTSLICGIFLLHDTQLNPLMATLPSVLKLKINDTKNIRLQGIVNLMLQEFLSQTDGNSFVLERYLEILCAEVIRTHVNTLPREAMGWLSALKDPIIGQAIEEIHLHPDKNWSVKMLAQKVALSPSRFAARFVETVGESPMIYVAKWRMYVASRDLINKKNSIEQIAGNVGYESVASFGRAFKRHMGISPAAWQAEINEDRIN